MKLDYFLQLLVPKDKKFYMMFESATANLVAISKVLIELLNSPSPEKRIELAKEIDQIGRAHV